MTAIVVLVKFLAWIFAILLSGKFDASAKSAEDVHICGGLYWNGVGACVGSAFFMLLVAWAILIWIFVPLACPYSLKVLLGLVLGVVSIILQQLFKHNFES
ncbi:MAG: hypothetical protein J6Y53_00425 [Alphaproteobacteria bacterium]|nr:hypothetical protein [Alphaproteobacteria bacterium]